MAVSYGWTGKLLWVDLTRNKISIRATADYEPEKYIGGTGLNSKIFWELGSPKVDAFSPDNPLLISVGPLTGLNGSVNRGEVDYQALIAGGPQAIRCNPEGRFQLFRIGDAVAPGCRRAPCRTHGPQCARRWPQPPRAMPW